jgi:hypothetical protein
MDRKTFIFYESYFNMGQQIEDKTVRCDFYESIVKAALKGEPLENTGNALIDMAYIGIRPLIEANIKNYQNGCKGGAPLGNGNAKKNNPKTTQKQPKTTEGQPYKDKDDNKDSYKDKNKDDYKDVNKDKDKEKKPSAISEEEEEFDIAEWEVPDDFFDEVEDKDK